MSGHSKWHNIQKTKGAADAKRSAAFTKIAKEIIVAVKQGGSGDPANNSRLATVVAKAKAAMATRSRVGAPHAAGQPAARACDAFKPMTWWVCMGYRLFSSASCGIPASSSGKNGLWATSHRWPSKSAK